MNKSLLVHIKVKEETSITHHIQGMIVASKKVTPLWKKLHSDKEKAKSELEHIT